MKKLFFISAAILAAAQVQAQTPDTVKVIDNPHQVIITETATGTKVDVVGLNNNVAYNYSYSVEHNADASIHTSQISDWDLNFPFKKSINQQSHWSITMKGLYFGAGVHSSFPLVNNSFHWGFLQIAGIDYNTLHGQSISFGVGFDSKRFSLKRPHCFVMNDEQTRIIETGEYPEGLDKRSSTLNIRSFQFPLLFQQKIYRSLHLTVGAAMNWNVYAKCNNHFKVGQTETDICYNGIKQNKVTFDFIGGLGFNVIGLYCRYSPSNVFKKGYGPEIKETCTLGVTIGL